jgi:hypothetical protein
MCATRAWPGGANDNDEADDDDNADDDNADDNEPVGSPGTGRGRLVLAAAAAATPAVLALGRPAVLVLFRFVIESGNPGARAIALRVGTITIPPGRTTRLASTRQPSRPP